MKCEGRLIEDQLEIQGEGVKSIDTVEVTCIFDDGQNQKFKCELLGKNRFEGHFVINGKLIFTNAVQVYAKYSDLTSDECSFDNVDSNWSNCG